MPFAIGNTFVTTYGRQMFVIMGTYTVPGLIGAFRALSLGQNPTQMFAQNADVDTNFTAFIFVGAVPPPGAIPVGSRVRVLMNSLAYSAAVPVTTFPSSNELGPEGIILIYASIVGFPGMTYAFIVEPDQNIFIAQFDELHRVNQFSI